MFTFPLSTIALIGLTVLVSSALTQAAYFPVQQRSEANSINVIDPSGSIEYQIVPSSEYSLATVQPTDVSIMDYVLSSVTAVIGLGSTALSAVSSIIINGSMILLGMAIVIGFCGLTPYCTLIIEKPSFLARENLSALPYLEELENFVSEAYIKYQEIQNSV